MRGKRQSPVGDTTALLPERPIESLDEYVDQGGGAALTSALQGSPAALIDEVSRSGLRGRGGAGFPTGAKWQSVRGGLDGAAMGEVAYVSEVRVEREAGPVRRAYLPAESQPIYYGTHGAVAEHYGHRPAEFPAHATTLDHVVGAAAG